MSTKNKGVSGVYRKTTLSGAILEVPCRNGRLCRDLCGAFKFIDTNLTIHNPTLMIPSWRYLTSASIIWHRSVTQAKMPAAIWISDKKPSPANTQSSWRSACRYPVTRTMILVDNLSDLKVPAYDKCQSLLVLAEPYLFPYNGSSGSDRSPELLSVTQTSKICC